MRTAEAAGFFRQVSIEYDRWNSDLCTPLLVNLHKAARHAEIKAQQCVGLISRASSSDDALQLVKQAGDWADHARNAVQDVREETLRIRRERVLSLIHI